MRLLAPGETRRTEVYICLLMVVQTQGFRTANVVVNQLHTRKATRSASCHRLERVEEERQERRRTGNDSQEV